MHLFCSSRVFESTPRNYDPRFDDIEVQTHEQDGVTYLVDFSSHAVFKHSVHDQDAIAHFQGLAHACLDEWGLTPRTAHSCDRYTPRKRHPPTCLPPGVDRVFAFISRRPPQVHVDEEPEEVGKWDAWMLKTRGVFSVS